MAPSCYICKCYVGKPKSIFRIPDRHDEFCERGKLWLKILDAQEESIDEIRVCSDHFLKKQPAKKGDFLNIDWVPNQNLGRFSKNVKYITNFFNEKKAALPGEFLRSIKIKEIYHGQSSLNNNDKSNPAKAASSASNVVTHKDVPLNPTTNIQKASDSSKEATSENLLKTGTEKAIGFGQIQSHQKFSEVLTMSEDNNLPFSAEIQTELTSGDIHTSTPPAQDCLEICEKCCEKSCTNGTIPCDSDISNVQPMAMAMAPESDPISSCSCPACRCCSAC